jgi:hypothetical protein
VKINHVSYGKWPYIFRYHGRPLYHGMQKDCTRSLDDATDESLGNSVLPVSTHSTEGKCLTLAEAIVLKYLSRIYAIICSNALNVHAILRSKLFEFFLGAQ